MKREMAMSQLCEDEQKADEPSAEMIAAGASILCGFDTSFEDEKSWALRVYRAMSALRSEPSP
jgi:hypothetical protein